MAGRKQTNRSRQPKMPLRRAPACFERNVAELKTEVGKLPVDRRRIPRRRPGTEEKREK